MDLVAVPDEDDPRDPPRLPPAVRDALPRLFVETTMPLALVDADGRLLAVNSGFSGLVGLPAGELAGRRLADVVHPDDRADHLTGWRALLGGVNHADRTEVRLLRTDGAELPVVVYRTVLAGASEPSGPVGLAAVHEHPAAAASSPARLMALGLDLATAVTDIDRLGDLVARAAADLVGDAAWVWQRDNSGTLHLIGGWHRDPARRDVLAAVLAGPVTEASGVVARAVGMGRSVRLTDGDLDPAREPLAAAWTSYAEHFGLSGIVVQPLIAREHVVGVLGLARDGGGPAYDDADVALAASIAETAAFPLDNSMLLANAQADERLTRTVLDTVPAMAAVLDRHGRIIDVNAAWSRSAPTHMSQSIGLGSNYLDVCDAAAALGLPGVAEVAMGVRAVLAGERADYAGDCAFNRGPDHEIWLHVHAARLIIPGTGDLAPVVVVDHHDITDRKQLEVRLAHDATHDPLTGLPNRVLLADRIEQALARDRRAGVRTAVLFCDLDEFKAVNDTLGHDGGDAVLRAAAERFAGTVRASDTVARMGGDEFVVLIESVTDIDEALLVADKLVLSLREPDHDDSAQSPPLPSVSVGVALSTNASTADSLLREADAAMYAAKQAGRSRVQVAGD